MVMGGATFQPSASPINPPGRHSPFNRPTSAPHGTRRLRSKRSLRIASSHVGANASATSPPRGPANSPPHDGVAAERSRASPTQLLSVVGLDDADDTAVRNTIFWRGAARHGVDPRLIHPMGPGPQKSPSVDLIKCVCMCRVLRMNRCAPAAAAAAGSCCVGAAALPALLPRWSLASALSARVELPDTCA